MGRVPGVSSRDEAQPIIEFEAWLDENSNGRFRFTDLPAGVYTAELGVPSPAGSEYQWITSETVQVSGNLERDFTLPE